MRLPPDAFALVLALIACAAADGVSSDEDSAQPADPAPAAKDEPKVPAPPAPGAADGVAAPAEPDPTEPKAREILQRAAERQGGAELAEPGKLESIHVEFFRVKFWAEETDEEGKPTRTSGELDPDGLVVDYKVPGSIRTRRVFEGKEIVRGRYEPKKVSWIWDGTKSSPLVGEQYARDLAELDRDRRIAASLLDVAILGKLLKDKSRLRVVEDDRTVEGSVAVARTPPAGAPSALPITLWIDEKTADLVAAKVPPTEQGASILRLVFEYDATDPAVEGAKVRFPFKVEVSEQRIEEQKPRPVLVVTARKVSFNSVSDDAFRQPR